MNAVVTRCERLRRPAAVAGDRGLASAAMSVPVPADPSPDGALASATHRYLELLKSCLTRELSPDENCIDAVYWIPDEVLGEPSAVWAKLHAMGWRLVRPMESDQSGHAVSVMRVPLSVYRFNIRSFHPNIKFERAGFRFSGDNRAFSLGDSYHMRPDDPSDGAISNIDGLMHAFLEQRRPGRPEPPSDGVTSRIWQRFNIFLDKEGNDVIPLKDNFQTESNVSSGPVSTEDEPYTDEHLKPRKSLRNLKTHHPHPGETVTQFETWYGGENHAFFMSRTLKKSLLNSTPVPTLDVFTRVWMKIERIRAWADFIVMTTGDGFPNCEAFVNDMAGKRIFLGTHVRVGSPVNHLPGENRRIMFATAFRVGLDKQGNFDERFWLFSHVLGGPPKDRHYAPNDPEFEKCLKPGESPPWLRHFRPGRPVIYWECSPLENIGDPLKAKKSFEPFFISDSSPADKVFERLEKSFKAGPIMQSTVKEWNDWHLHRDPNGGRYADSHDVSPDKWRKNLELPP